MIWGWWQDSEYSMRGVWLGVENDIGSNESVNLKVKLWMVVLCGYKSTRGDGRNCFTYKDRWWDTDKNK